ncbi:unnamed protein product [Calypogeia fissa]
MVLSATHIPGHATSYVARLKEEAYVIRHSGDLFYPFAIEAFGALHLTLDPRLDRKQLFVWSGGCAPRSRWLWPFLSRLRSKGLRPLRSNNGQGWLVLEPLGMFLSMIRP